MVRVIGATSSERVVLAEGVMSDLELYHELLVRVQSGAIDREQSVSDLLTVLRAAGRRKSPVNEAAIAKLPPGERAAWIDRSETMSPVDFVPLVNARLEQLRHDDVA